MKELAEAVEPLRKKYGEEELRECLEGIAALYLLLQESQEKK